MDLPTDKIVDILQAHYHLEVAKRGHIPVFNSELYEILRQVAAWLADPYGKPGLMLQGLYGNGKSTMMRAIVEAVNRLYFHPEYERRIEFSIADARDIARIAVKPQDKAEAEFKKLCALPYLAIDDLGEEPAEILNFGMVHTPVKDLLLQRYKRRAMTIVTTNLVNSAHKRELSAHYGERVVDRFREMMKIIVFKNPSYRK